MTSLDDCFTFNDDCSPSWDFVAENHIFGRKHIFGRNYACPPPPNLTSIMDTIRQPHGALAVGFNITRLCFSLFQGLDVCHVRGVFGVLDTSRGQALLFLRVPHLVEKELLDECTRASRGSR
jgi:hypothetical protein